MPGPVSGTGDAHKAIQSRELPGQHCGTGINFLVHLIPFAQPLPGLELGKKEEIPESELWEGRSGKEEDAAGKRVRPGTVADGQPARYLLGGVGPAHLDFLTLPLGT